MEEPLRESERRYRDLYENAPNAYCSIRALDGSILICNSTALQLLGHDKKTIVDMKVLNIINYSKRLDNFKSDITLA
ncbi:PAS domain S-box protein [Thermodesulfobacteriota bacterium]